MKFYGVIVLVVTFALTVHAAHHKTKRSSSGNLELQPLNNDENVEKQRLLKRYYEYNGMDNDDDDNDLYNKFLIDFYRKLLYSRPSEDLNNADGEINHSVHKRPSWAKTRRTERRAYSLEE
jgi:hypothetical protein